MAVDLRSDNTHGASPEILDAVKRAGGGSVSSYGADDITARVRQRVRDVFETNLEIIPVISGTAGNSLAIASMTPPWGGVFCHEDAHIQRDELGAPEFFTNGAKLIPIAGRDGKLWPNDLAGSISDVADTGRMASAACVSLTQATEAGTVYSPAEMRALGDIAHKRGAGVHMDGARFANALVSLGCTPAEISWKAGVDVLVFGATKNGAMGAELIITFNKDLAAEVSRRTHRAGHRLSKMRFITAQMDAYLTDDLWLRNARHANAMAAALADGLRDCEGAEILRPVEANVLFVRFAPELHQRLRAEGHLFYEWTPFGADAFRLVTGFSTEAAQVGEFVGAVRGSKLLVPSP